MKYWFQSIGVSLASLLLVAGSAYAVSTISENLATNGTLHVGTGTGDEGTLDYDTSTNTLVVNEAGGDINFRVETDTDPNGIFLDAGGESIDLAGGSGSTGCTVDSSGNLTCTGNIVGANTDPTPVFDFNPGDGSGIDKMTLTSAFDTAMTTVILCDNRTDTGTTFPCTTGGTFTEPDGGVTTGYAAPFTEAAARSSDYDRFYRHQAPDTSVGEAAAGTDFSLIIVAFVTDRGATQYIASKYDTANSLGYAIRVTSGGIVQGVANATTFGSYQLDAFGEWNVYELACNSTECGLYVNGYLSGSVGARPSSMATSTVAKNFSMGCRPNAVNTDCIDGKIALTRVRTCSACIASTAAMTAAAQQHAQELMGVWPTEAVVFAPLSTALRDSPAYLDIVRDDDDIRRAFRVGDKWLRVSRRREATTGGGYVMGYLAEAQSINLALRNSEFGNAAWTQLNGDSVSSNLVAGPAANGTDFEGDRFVAALDVVGVEHGLRQAVTLTATPYVFSVFFLYDAGSAHKRYAFLRDNTIGPTAIAYFDLLTCKALTQGAGLHYSSGGEGPYAGARTQFYGVPSSNFYICRAEIVIDGTAASHNLDIGYADADGDTTFTTTASQTLGALWGAQVEAQSHGYVASAAIPTSASSQTRNLDSFRFDISNFPGQPAQLAWSALMPDSRLANGGVGNVAAHVCDIFKDSNNYILLKSTASNGQGLRDGVQGTGGGVFVSVLNAGTAQINCCSNSPPGQWYAPPLYNMHDGMRHRARLTLIDNDFRAYVDGDQAAGVSDTSGTVPDLTGGAIYIGAESSDINQSGGLVEYCRIYDQDFEPQFP